MKKTRIVYLLALLLLLIILVTVSPARNVPAAPSVLTRYYTMMGFEGISTWGNHLGSNGPRPPVSDYATTQCQYINVPNTTVGDYYIRFPIRLPDGATMTKVSMRIADFHSGGSMFAYLRSRNWNSRDFGDTLGLALTSPGGTGSDELIHIDGLNVAIDNSAKSYWLDLSPQNSADPGQLCVYSVQIVYDIDGTMLPLITKGN
jgi:hypothetical protein